MEEIVVNVLHGLLGVFVFFLICYGLSVDRRSINWRLVGSGILIQLVLAFVMLKIPLVETCVGGVAILFKLVLDFSLVGSSFLFGELANDPENIHEATLGFRVMPSIIFFATLSSILYYLGILQKIVYVFAWVMHRTMKLSGAETLSAAANVFIGYTEAPLVVRPYLERMTRSEIVCLMTVGMATMSGTILGIYMTIVGGGDHEKTVQAGKFLITASIMAAPIAIVVSKIIYPEREEINRDLKVSRESIGVNFFDALTNGVTQGVKLAVTVTALLIVFISLIHMVNYLMLNLLGGWTGLNELIVSKTDGNFEGLTLQFVFALIFFPVAWLAGVDLENALLVGRLLGERLAVTEFVAYLALGDMIANGVLTNPKAIIISTFALCGFAHFTSCGIIIGGISTLAPGQRENCARYVLYALAGATIATLINATVAGTILG